MKITLETINEIPVQEQLLMSALLDDVADINKNSPKGDIFIDWQDYHDVYSSERTEPCPDFYGYYTLRFEVDPYNNIGNPMTIDDLNEALCLLYDYLVII